MSSMPKRHFLFALACADAGDIQGADIILTRELCRNLSERRVVQNSRFVPIF